MHKPAITQVDIDTTISDRWSGRAYDAAKHVEHAQVVALLEAARWAPSCYGDQPWRFLTWNKATDPAGWQQALDCLVPGNQAWAANAPVLILSCADTLLSQNQKPNRFAQYDTGAAAENLCLQAASMGLMAHQMGGFDIEMARKQFNIPEQFTVMAMISVGYPADIATLNGDALSRETAARSRKPLAELFFEGMWGKGVRDAV